MLSILPLKLLGNQTRNVAKNIRHHHGVMHGNNVLSADVFWPPIKKRREAEYRIYFNG